MASFQLPARLIVACGFAVAIAAAPAVAVFAVPAASSSEATTTCPAGEEEDLYSGACLPHMVPSSPVVSSTPAGFQPIPGNPDLLEIDGIPCTGRNSGQCVGLSENQTPFVQPTSTVSASP